MGSPITTHILDTANGSPAADVPVTLERYVEHRGSEGTWRQLAAGVTNLDGRIADLLPGGTILEAGSYRLLFEVDTYFRATATESFYRTIPIVFEVVHVDQHYHVPLLLNPFGYSTYRGS